MQWGRGKCSSPLSVQPCFSLLLISLLHKNKMLDLIERKFYFHKNEKLRNEYSGLGHLQVFLSRMVFLLSSFFLSTVCTCQSTALWWKLSVTVPVFSVVELDSIILERESQFKGQACDQLGRVASCLVLLCRRSKKDCLFSLDCSLCVGCQVAFFLALWESSSEGSFRGQSRAGTASPDDTLGICGRSCAPGRLTAR